MGNKFICVLSLVMLAFVCMCQTPALAEGADAIPGDVIVVFRNPFPEMPITSESLAMQSEGNEAGKHRAYVEAAAESLDAKVAFIYETFSILNDSIVALVHSDTRNEHTLMMKLKMRSDVKGASLNYVNRLNVNMNVKNKRSLAQ